MIKPTTMRYLTDDELTRLEALVAEEKARREDGDHRGPAGTAGEPGLVFIHNARPYTEKTVGAWAD